MVPEETPRRWTHEVVERRALALANAVRTENATNGATYRSAAEGPLDLSDLDSFSLLELMVACEDEFGVSFDAVELDGQSLEELINFIVLNASAPVGEDTGDALIRNMASGQGRVID